MIVYVSKKLYEGLDIRPKVMSLCKYSRSPIIAAEQQLYCT
jgi:hypothetical protein